MISRNTTLDQIRELGVRALINQLGPVGMIRFLQQTETGWGNYTAERHKWLGDPDLKTLAEEIKSSQQEQSAR